MKAKKFLAKVMAVTMVFAAAGAILPNTVTDNYSITASAGIGEGTKESPYGVGDYDNLKSFVSKAYENTPLYLALTQDIEINDGNDNNYILINDPNVNKEIHIDLNGHSIKRVSIHKDELNGDPALFYINEGGSLSITDSKGKGYLGFTQQDTATYLFYNNGGTLNIYEGEYRMNNEDESSACIWSNGETNIYGGDFYAYCDVLRYAAGKLRIYDGNFYVTMTEPQNSKNGAGMKFGETVPVAVPNYDFKIYNLVLKTIYHNITDHPISLKITGDRNKLGTFADHITKDTEMLSDYDHDINSYEIEGNSYIGALTYPYFGDLNYDFNIDIEDAVNIIAHINGIKPLPKNFRS